MRINLNKNNTPNANDAQGGNRCSFHDSHNVHIVECDGGSYGESERAGSNVQANGYLT